MCALPAAGVNATPKRASASGSPCAACRSGSPMGPQGGKCTCGRRTGPAPVARPAPVPSAEGRPGVGVLVEKPGVRPPPAPPPPMVVPPPDKVAPPSVEPRLAPAPEPPVVDRVPSKSPEVPKTTVFLGRQPAPPPEKAPATPRLVPPLLFAPPQAAPQQPGYCDDPRFANTELCYQGGVPASQGRPPMSVVEKGNPELKGPPVVERVPGAKPSAGPGFLGGQFGPSYEAPPRLGSYPPDNSTSANWDFGPGAEQRFTKTDIRGGFSGFGGSPVVRVADIAPAFKGGKPSAGPSHPIVGPTAVQYRPARGPSLSIERSSIPASQYRPGQGLLPVSNYMPPGPIKAVSGLAGPSAGVPSSHQRSIEMVGVPVSQYRPSGLVGVTRAQCVPGVGRWDPTANGGQGACIGAWEPGHDDVNDGDKPQGADHTDAILGAVGQGIGALGQTITRILQLENERIQGRLTEEGRREVELARINAQRDLAATQAALADARSQGANDSALQALTAQLAALTARAQDAGVQVGMSLPAKIGLAVGGTVVVGGLAYLLATRARSNPSAASRVARASARRAARRNGRRRR